jgi:transcriptional regulator with XRE-family HTH domain
MPMNLSKFLRRERRKHKMTQEDVARRLDVTVNTVAAWERDESSKHPASVPNPYQLRDLAKLFGVTADKLLSLLPPPRVADR